MKEIKQLKKGTINNCEKCRASYGDGPAEFWCQLSCIENGKIKTPKGFCEFCK